jgi:hypothetical protein
MKRALRRWIEADTGAFTQTLSLGGASGQTTTGVYQMSSRTSSSTQVTESPSGERFRFQFLGVEDVSYMNTRGWPDGLGRCWLRFDGDAIEQNTGYAQVPGSGGLPANVVALSYAAGTGTDPDNPDVVTGTVDLPAAAAMFGSGVLRLFDDPTMDAPVSAEFTLVDGDIVGWRVTGDDLVTALDREGLLEGVSDDVRSGMATVEVIVEYRQLGSAEVDARPPDRPLQMTPEQMDSREGCPATR